jgi:hypothetical protein
MPLTLVPVDDRESDFGLDWRHTDISSCAHDELPSCFLRDRDQGDVLVEIDVQKEVLLPFREIALGREEAKVPRPGPDLADGRHERFAVFRPVGANYDLTPVAQPLGRRILGCIGHVAGYAITWSARPYTYV